jgi:predicted Zn-dependent protease
MTRKAIITLLLILSLTSTTIILVEAQTQSEYVLELQGPTWDHSTIRLIITPKYNEPWWDPAYLNSTLRAISQWNEAIAFFASNQTDFAYLSGLRMIPEVSNSTRTGSVMQISWIQQFGNVTCEAGLTRTTYEISGVIKDSDVNLSAFDCRGNILSEVDMQNVALHELGHVLGLGHASNTGDLMHFAYTLNSPIRAISTLDVYGVANVFRWMSASPEFDPSNQGPKIFSITLPSSMKYEYLQVSNANLPAPQSPLDSFNNFVADVIDFILRPEILIAILVAIAAIVVFGVMPRRSGKREANNKPSDVSVEREIPTE